MDLFASLRVSFEIYWIAGSFCIRDDTCPLKQIRFCRKVIGLSKIVFKHSCCCLKSSIIGFSKAGLAEDSCHAQIFSVRFELNPLTFSSFSLNLIDQSIFVINVRVF